MMKIKVLRNIMQLRLFLFSAGVEVTRVVVQLYSSGSFESNVF